MTVLCNLSRDMVSIKNQVPMYFCIFSFNRGQLLKNCVSSIELCVDKPNIIVFDDNSTDRETMAVLSEINEKHDVIVPKLDDQNAHKCGGLYNNMQLALDSMPEESLVCFVQDDTQFVRPIDQHDMDDIEHFFAHHQQSAFMQCAFLKGKARNRVNGYTYFDNVSGAYLRQDVKQSAGIYFSAVSIGHVGRLKAVDWTFKSREKDNNTQAKALFGPMGFMKNPFLMYLPSAPAYRGKMKTLGHKLAEKKNNCGFHPFNLMEDAQLAAFKARNPSTLPFAEDFLSLAFAELPKPWVTNPFQGTKILKALHKAELVVRKKFG
ncbi:glycosyltransferase family A protein [Thalassotalea euphylliae]|uniref:glycosyltransferase family A protein n=1 Tax=Thalassotalea euphylliae TaxID=1655234 RepID=UPI00362F07A9